MNGKRKKHGMVTNHKGKNNNPANNVSTPTTKKNKAIGVPLLY